MSNLEGITYYGHWSLEDILEYNVIQFFRYGLLELGAYINITKDQQNYLGQDVSRLSPVVNVSGVTNYTVYKGAKDDWVWETGVTLKSTGVAPYVPSGIYVNNTFYATGSAPTGNSYVLDFSRGQVIFTSGLTSSDSVQVSHAVRIVDVHSIESQEFNTLAENWNTLASSGNTNYFRNQTYLPAVFVEIANINTRKGIELGSRAKETIATMNFHIVGYNITDVRKLSTVCYFLETKSFNIYNLANINFALNDRGQLIYPSSTWAALSQNVLYQARFEENAKVNKLRVPQPLFGKTVQIGLFTATAPI